MLSEQERISLITHILLNGIQKKVGAKKVRSAVATLIRIHLINLLKVKSC